MKNETQTILINLINSRLDKFEEKNDVAHKDILAVLAIENKDIREKVDDHCLRLREIEKNQAVETYKLAAVVSGAVFIIYFAVNAVWNYLSHKI